MIDIKTFMLVLAIGNFGFAMLMAGYERSGSDNPAMRMWKWAKVVQGFAHLIGWVRPDYPYVWVSVASNITLVLGAMLEVAAYYTFFGFQRWQRILYPLTALALVVHIGMRLGGASLNTLSSVMAVIIALLSGVMAYVLLRPQPEVSRLQRIIGINDLVFFLAMATRAAVGAVHGGLTVFEPSLVQTFTYMAAYLLMIVNGFGFLLLCKEKDDRNMSRLATIDSLTGLVNRRAFFDRTSAARTLAARSNMPIALMMLDIDHFKHLNDRFGHAAGDQALCVFSATTLGMLRKPDVMGRLGGEEFAVVLPGTDLAGALQAAERLRAGVASAALSFDGEAYSMTVSIGVVLLDASEHINAALARADRALYAAKSAGRNRVAPGEAMRVRDQACG